MKTVNLTDPKQDKELFEAMLRTPEGKRIAEERRKDFHQSMMEHSLIYPLMRKTGRG